MAGDTKYGEANDMTWTEDTMSPDAALEEDWLWLCSVAGLDWKQRLTLLHYFGSPGEIRRADPREFETWEKLGIFWVKHLYPAFRDDLCGKMHREMEKHQIRFVSREHPLFPEKLKKIADCPHGLFFKGSLPSDETPGNRKVLSVAVIGARSCSSYGAGMAKELGRMLADAGVQVVSGMAYGIDGIAQRAAVEGGGETYAVLGGGAEQCYPRSNLELYLEIPAHGGIISEYPCGTAALPRNFVSRNRIISGLSDALVVVEARAKSGTLITADFALEQGRDIYAVPGRTGDALSFGCNRLIAEGAGLVLSADVLVDDLRVRFPDCFDEPAGSKKKKSRESKAFTQEEAKLYSILDQTPKSIDELLEESAFPPGTLHRSLMSLQLCGAVSEVGKGHYVRTFGEFARP